MHPAVFLRLALHKEGRESEIRTSDQGDNANEPDLYLSVVNPFLGRKSKPSSNDLDGMGAFDPLLQTESKPTSRFPSALDVALYEIIT
jgi:hypothetical protein